VGEPCSDDFFSESWGCGGSPMSETCAEGLACCPTAGSSSYPEPPYVCVASDRCATSGLGDWCESRRDCAHPYDCVQNICSGALGTPCSEHRQCVTRYCDSATGECSYPPLDAGPTDSSVDAGPDAGGGDAGVEDAGGDAQGPDAAADAAGAG
jgi:hypothetical protein